MPHLIIGFGVFVVLGIFCFLTVGISISNSLVRLRKQVDRAWANIEVVLEQRHGEIPKLLSVCEQFANYERATFDRIIQAREKYLLAKTVNSKVSAANEVSESLTRILALGEAYPQLQSSAQFVQLQTRVSALEGEITDRREVFNEAVTNFNTRIAQFPDLFFAQVLHYTDVQLYRPSQSQMAEPEMKMKLPA